MFWSIETAYNGAVYRSRTEARYALMFDRAGIDFQYEPDGYAFEEKCQRYVPDFWVPEWDAFLEIKPDTFSMIPGEWPPERCVCELLMEATNKHVFLAPGSPYAGRYMHHFQPGKLGFEQTWLATLVPAWAILAAKNHRFDWRSEPRQRPRPRFTGDGAIGDIAGSVIDKLKTPGSRR